MTVCLCASARNKEKKKMSNFWQKKISVQVSLTLRHAKPLCLSPLLGEKRCSVCIHFLTVKAARVFFYFILAGPE